MDNLTKRRQAATRPDMHRVTAPKPDPKTCQEAAERFRIAADKAHFLVDKNLNRARAEILDAFEDQPLPQAIIRSFDWEKI